MISVTKQNQIARQFKREASPLFPNQKKITQLRIDSHAYDPITFPVFDSLSLELDCSGPGVYHMDMREGFTSKEKDGLYELLRSVIRKNNVNILILFHNQFENIIDPCGTLYEETFQWIEMLEIPFSFTENGFISISNRNMYGIPIELLSDKKPGIRFMNIEITSLEDLTLWYKTLNQRLSRIDEIHLEIEKQIYNLYPQIKKTYQGSYLINGTYLMYGISYDPAYKKYHGFFGDDTDIYNVDLNTLHKKLFKMIKETILTYRLPDMLSQKN
jgi:hypothetical protein